MAVNIDWVHDNFPAIQYAKAQEPDTALLRLKEENVIYQGSFNDLEIFLTSKGFIRVDRGVIVNISSIKLYDSIQSFIILDDETKIEVVRSRNKLIVEACPNNGKTNNGGVYL